MSTTDEVGNFDGLALDDLPGLLANVPAKPLMLLVAAALLGEGAALTLGAAPNEKEVVDDFSDPKPVETAPNPPPKPVDLDDEEVASTLLESALSVEDVGLNAPNPLETAPNPEPKPPVLAAAPNPVLPVVDPNAGTLALDHGSLR